MDGDSIGPHQHFKNIFRLIESDTLQGPNQGISKFAIIKAILLKV